MKLHATLPLVLALVLGLGGAAGAQEVELTDPSGDDKGPGSYTYPTDAVYKRGSFDLTKVKIVDKGSEIEVTVAINSKIEDPWGSRSWKPAGYGFSVQMAFLFIDTDHKAGSGHTEGVPGLNVQFAADNAWEKVFVISPQGAARVKREIKAKGGKLQNDIVVAKSVQVRGKALVARFPKDGIGTVSASWGYQVLMQSNEGYPKENELLTRKVTEVGGQHLFGGGHDYECDPHVIDLLAGKATGADSERAAQFAMLKGWKCAPDPEKPGALATIKMVYPGG